MVGNKKNGLTDMTIEEKQKRAAYEAKIETSIQGSVAKLKREVSLEFGFKDIYPTLETAMRKYGQVEFCKKSPVGVRVRYMNQIHADKSLRGKKLTVRLPVHIYPAEIKHHAAYFDAPEEMGELDDDILGQVKVAMSNHGEVASVKKKGKSIVVFFASREIRNSLISPEGNTEVTIEIGDHAVALHAGLPPTIAKRRKMAQRNKEKAKKAQEFAKACGQPPPKMMKSSDS